MADSYRNIAQALLDRANLRYQAKGTSYDVLYTEQETIDRSQAIGRYVGLDKPHIPARCIPGAKHPRCNYLVLVDAYRTGGDDHHDNWTLLYRVDIQQLEVDGQNPGFTFPDFLANDGAATQFPYFDNSEDITWQFDVILPNGETIIDPSGHQIVDPDGNPLVAPNLGYSMPAQGTPHPLATGALFLSEQWQRNGPVLTVIRHYKKVAPASAQQKIGYTITGEYAAFHLVSWTYETTKADYNPPAAGASCPIHDAQNPATLDFSSYKVIAPPKVDPLDPLNLRVTVTYGAIPGPLIAMTGFATGPTSKGVTYLQRRAMSDVFASQALQLDSEEVNGFSKVWKWQVPEAVTLSSQNYDQGTGLRDLISQVLVATGTSGQNLDANGVMAEIKALNEHYAIKETTTIALFAQRPTFIDYEVDPETRNLITVTRTIVLNSGGAPSITTGSEVTQKQLNNVFSLRVVRSIGDPHDYDVPEHVDFTVPSILQSLTGVSGDNGSTWIVNAEITSSYRKQLQARRYITFHSTPPASSDLWTIKPTTFHYDGVHFKIRLENVIMDAIPNFGAVGTAYTEQVNIPASSPTKAQYTAAINVEQLWAEQCAPWRYGYWRREQLKVIPE